MKNPIWLLPAILLLPTLSPATCRAQGSLTPKGPPSTTMKSLDQVEPRIPVDSVHTPGLAGDQYYITQPGSYYLTGDIIGVKAMYGIEIGASNVTLDLNGFSLLGVSNSQTAITVDSPSVLVRNGTIKGWGAGIYDIVSGIGSRIYEKLTICSNGNGGINCVTPGVVVRDCVVEGNARYGIQVSGMSRITGCTVDGNAGGIALSGPGSSYVEDNFVFANDPVTPYAEILVISSSNHIANNRVIVTSTNGFGIEINGPYINNVIVNNDVAGGGTRNFNLQPGNDIGPIGAATNSASPWANISH